MVSRVVVVVVLVVVDICLLSHDTHDGVRLIRSGPQARDTLEASWGAASWDETRRGRQAGRQTEAGQTEQSELSS